MMKEANDKSGPQYQRMTWDALRKSLNGLINKVNVQNIKEILPTLFGEVCLISHKLRASLLQMCIWWEVSTCAHELVSSFHHAALSFF